MKHTQGEWKVNVTDQTNVFEIVARRPNERETICIVNSETDEGARANAILIAAAPELLTACIEYRKLIQAEGCISDIEQIKLSELIYSAIKKATR